MTIFTLIGFMLAPFIVIFAILLATFAVFGVFWAVLALPIRFAFPGNWPIATTATATGCVMAAAAALILLPHSAYALYHAARGLLGVA